MKNFPTFLLVILCSSPAFCQYDYNTISEQTIGTVKCVYTKATNDKGKRYNVSIFFHDIGYGMQCDASQRSVSLSHNKDLESFISDLKACVNYLEAKQKQGQVIYENEYYTLVIHDRPNKIFLYSSGRTGYTWLTVRAATDVVSWLSAIEFPSNS